MERYIFLDMKQTERISKAVNKLTKKSVLEAKKEKILLLGYSVKRKLSQKLGMDKSG